MLTSKEGIDHRLEAGADGGNKRGQLGDIARLIAGNLLSRFLAFNLIEAHGIALGIHAPDRIIRRTHGKQLINGGERDLRGLVCGGVDVDNADGEQVVLQVSVSICRGPIDKGDVNGSLLTSFAVDTIKSDFPADILIGQKIGAGAGGNGIDHAEIFIGHAQLFMIFFGDIIERVDRLAVFVIFGILHIELVLFQAVGNGVGRFEGDVGRPAIHFPGREPLERTEGDHLSAVPLAHDLGLRPLKNLDIAAVQIQVGHLAGAQAFFGDKTVGVHGDGHLETIDGGETEEHIRQEGYAAIMDNHVIEQITMRVFNMQIVDLTFLPGQEIDSRNWNEPVFVIFRYLA